jgi:K(+)-stimulated pyrophosphate-energized sodium pump
VQFNYDESFRDGAEQQLKHVAAILKAFPAVKISLGSYTDNTGSEEINASMSQERVEKVKQKLRALGIGRQIVKARGYGVQDPIADNNTWEGRALNRRVSCRIVSVKK